MSDNMLSGDLSPNRLSRAKFKLRDLLAHKDVGQFGLIAYTSEPFVVSPLTDDGQTISALLSNLTPDVMPVEGYNLDSALKEASKLIKEAGYQQGQILVLTAEVPSKDAIEKANQLSKLGIFSSIMPIRADSNLNPLFGQFASAGNGQFLKYTADDSDLQQWLAATKGNEQFTLNEEDDIPLWRDEGRWFLIPALLLLLPIFQRGWLQRVKI
jgi:Ca-activated chloride channel family protein